MEYPNLKGVVHKQDVEQVKAGSYSADYVNWSRTMQILRDHAPGWLPDLVPTPEGSFVHPSPGVGGFLLIRFRHVDGAETPAVPQAIMDNRNAAIPLDKITSRDITDTHRRGVCMAAALTFGLAYELWAKMPLESGYAPEQTRQPTPPAELAPAEQVEQFWALVEKVAAADPDEKHSVAWWRQTADKASERDNDGRPVAHLTSDELAALASQFQAHYGKLKTSAGESPQLGTDGSSGNKEAPDAPAESVFKAPKGPRGQKAAA